MPVVPDSAFVPAFNPGMEITHGKGLPYNTTRATPEAFGSQIGQTLNVTGDMLEKHSVARQQMINATNVDDTYANQFDPAFRQMYMDFLRLRGKDAEEQFPVFQQKMKDLASDTAAGLPNDLQRHTFNEISRRRMMSDLDGMARHAVAQTVAWQNETTNAMSDLYSRRIVDNRLDFDKVAGPQGLIQSIKNLNTAHSALMGEDKSRSDLRASASVDKGLSDAVLTEAAANPDSAKILYDRYAPYMSSDAVRQHVLDNLLPTIRQEQSTAVYKDVVTKFKLSDPDSDINAATKWVMDPNNYKDQLGDPNQRNDIARAIQGEWNRVRQVRKDNQSLADNNFTDAIAREQIAGMQLQTWRDPKTGLKPSGHTLQAGMEHDANPIELKTSDRQTLVNLTDDISNMRISDPSPINDAYLHRRITHQDFTELTNLYNSYQDPEKSPSLRYAKEALFSKYAMAGKIPDNVQQILPRFMSDYERAVRDKNLTGVQTHELADKMLESVDKQLISHWYDPWSWGKGVQETQEALDFSKQRGGWPKPVINQPANTQATTAPGFPAFVQSSEPSATRGPAATTPENVPGNHKGVPTEILKTSGTPAPNPAALEWSKNYLIKMNKEHSQQGLPQIPITDGNIKAAHDHFQAQDPQFWKHWELKGD